MYCLLIGRVIKWLIEEGGANIDVQDEYSSSKRKSRQLRTLPSHGIN